MNIRKKSKLTQKKRRDKSAAALKKISKTLAGFDFLKNPEHVLKTLSKSGLVTVKHDKIVSHLRQLHVHGLEKAMPDYQYVKSEKAVARKEKNRAALNDRLAHGLKYLTDMGFDLDWMGEKQQAA